MAFGEKSLFEYIFLHISWPQKGCYQQQSDMSFHLHMILFLDEYLQKSKLNDICLHLSIIFHSLFLSKTDFHFPTSLGVCLHIQPFLRRKIFLPSSSTSHRPRSLTSPSQIFRKEAQAGFCTQTVLHGETGSTDFHPWPICLLPSTPVASRQTVQAETRQDSRKERELGSGSG